MNPGMLSIATRALAVDPEKAYEALVNTAANFIASGGIVTLAEYAALPDEERRALYEAARLVEVARAKILAREILKGQINPEYLLANERPAPGEVPPEVPAAEATTP